MSSLHRKIITGVTSNNRIWKRFRSLVRAVGIQFLLKFDQGEVLHSRHIVTEHGWKILLDRGLDIFQRYEMNEAVAFENRLQQYRPCKAFEVAYLQS